MVLAALTVIYNLAEGVVATYVGIQQETLTFADVAGSLAFVCFSVKEGKEAFEKAKGIRENCCQGRN
jgi:hypothetical protein